MCIIQHSLHINNNLHQFLVSESLLSEVIGGSLQNIILLMIYVISLWIVFCKLGLINIVEIELIGCSKSINQPEQLYFADYINLNTSYIVTELRYLISHGCHVNRANHFKSQYIILGFFIFFIEICQSCQWDLVMSIAISLVVSLPICLQGVYVEFNGNSTHLSII